MNSLLALPLLCALSVFLVTWLIIRCGERFSWIHDHETTAIQKLHINPVPRVGGVAIATSVWLLECLTSLMGRTSSTNLSLLVLVASLPVFASGLLEDLTKRVGPRERLFAAFLSAGIASLWFGANLVKVEIPGVDYLLSHFYVFSLLFTCFAVGGVAHSYNLIDGINGLASGMMMIALAALASVAYVVGDNDIVNFALVTAGGVLGFMIWNFPNAKIFLGDSGAYFIGFLIAEMSVLLVIRNPEVSPWFPIVASGYPIIETLFSIFRRKILLKSKVGSPDNEHLHQLVYRNLKNSLADKPTSTYHFYTALIAWCISAVTASLSVVLFSNSMMLVLVFLLASFFFVTIYLTHFRLLSLKFIR